MAMKGGTPPHTHTLQNMNLTTRYSLVSFLIMTAKNMTGWYLMAYQLVSYLMPEREREREKRNWKKKKKSDSMKMYK